MIMYHDFFDRRSSFLFKDRLPEDYFIKCVQDEIYGTTRCLRERAVVVPVEILDYPFHKGLFAVGLLGLS